MLSTGLVGSVMALSYLIYVPVKKFLMKKIYYICIFIRPQNNIKNVLISLMFSANTEKNYKYIWYILFTSSILSYVYFPEV